MPQLTAGQSERELLSARWCQPSVSVVDVRVGSAADEGNAHYRFGPTRFSVIPRAAVGKVSLRFVPDQTAEELLRCLTAHLEHEFAKLRSGNKLSIKVGWGGGPLLASEGRASVVGLVILVNPNALWGGGGEGKGFFGWGGGAGAGVRGGAKVHGVSDHSSSCPPATVRRRCTPSATGGKLTLPAPSSRLLSVRCRASGGRPRCWCARGARCR